MSRSNLSGLNFSEIQRRKLRVASSKKPAKSDCRLNSCRLIERTGPPIFPAKLSLNICLEAINSKSCSLIFSFLKKEIIVERKRKEKLEIYAGV